MDLKDFRVLSHMAATENQADEAPLATLTIRTEGMAAEAATAEMQPAEPVVREEREAVVALQAWEVPATEDLEAAAGRHMQVTEAKVEMADGALTAFPAETVAMEAMAVTAGTREVETAERAARAETRRHREQEALAVCQLHPTREREAQRVTKV